QAGAVGPAPGCQVEPVVPEQSPAVAGDQADRLDDVVGDRVGQEVVEVHPYPAGLDPLAATGDLALELVAAFDVDAEQPVTVGAGARTPATRLDAEQVVEHRDHEVVVEELPRWRADHKREDRESLRLEVA